jgi:asparagine synthase (glutamine-hydrolysing)
MCGIVGVIFGSGLDCDLQRIERMMNAVRHRGPDSAGTWSENGTWLGHRRLAIIDVSAAGHQPMQSADGRYVITYNGEIYNHAELKNKVEQHSCIAWRGHSDTEVLLEAIGVFGIEQTLTLANGMFAFAVWDRREQSLTLARDRFGEKPLYYAQRGRGLAFASEVRALRAHGGMNLSISREALYWYFRYGYVPTPLSIYKSVTKLPPGHFMTWKDGHCSVPKSYWSLAQVAEMGMSQPFANEVEALAALESALSRACSIRMVSDVPLGAFLSGGIDSSIVAALMQASSSRPVKTFTIGFDEKSYDEAQYAHAVARHLGTEHTSYVATETDALAIFPKLGLINDEPLGDSSSIPTYLVSAMSRRHVTVCLSGDGGDEIFAGYERYRRVRRAWMNAKSIPFRRFIGRMIGLVPPQSLNALVQPLAFLAVRDRASRDSLGPKVHRIAERLESPTLGAFYDHSMRHSSAPERFVTPKGEQKLWRPVPPSFSDPIDWMCFQDSTSYLPGDILAKVDQASMSVSLEGRMPMLDPNVVETAWRIPARMKAKNGVLKWPLRQLLYKYVPRTLVDRPKMGFGIPLREWLLGPLKPWARDLLSYDRLRQQGIVNAAAAACYGEEFFAGGSAEAQGIWTMLALQIWLDHQAL